jgi:hypothetical protein
MESYSGMNSSRVQVWLRLLAGRVGSGKEGARRAGRDGPHGRQGRPAGPAARVNEGGRPTGPLGLGWAT